MQFMLWKSGLKPTSHNVWSNWYKLLYLMCLLTWSVAHPDTAVSFRGRCTAHSQLLTAITNCHCARVGERQKLVCVYSLTDPLIPATPVSLLCPNLSGGLTGPGWQMGRRDQPSVGCVESLRLGVSLSPLSSALDHLWHGLRQPKGRRGHTNLSICLGPAPSHSSHGELTTLGNFWSVRCTKRTCLIDTLRFCRSFSHTNICSPPHLPAALRTALWISAPTR